MDTTSSADHRPDNLPNVEAIPPSDAAAQAVPDAPDVGEGVMDSEESSGHKSHRVPELVANEMLTLLSEIRDLILPPDDVQDATASHHGLDAGAKTAIVKRLFSDYVNKVESYEIRSLRGLSKGTMFFWSISLKIVEETVRDLLEAQNNAEIEQLRDQAKPRFFWFWHIGRTHVLSLNAKAHRLATLPEHEEGTDPLNIDPLIRWYHQTTESKPSPLEAEIRAPVLKGLPGNRHCLLLEFGSLGGLFEMTERASNAVGRLQTVRLFRSTKWPINHEFLIAGFGLEGRTATSWIRVERAARAKAPSALRADSSHPVFSGVDSRETITLASSLEVLCHGAKELASLELHSFSTSPSIQPFIAQMILTSLSNELYQLFTANCRWFARRGFLNILQYTERTLMPHELMWKGKSATALEMEGRLKAEWFGGSTLRDQRSKGLDVSALVDMELSQSALNTSPSSQLKVFNSYLATLADSDIGTTDRDAIRAPLLLKRGRTAKMIPDIPLALRDMREAVALMRSQSSRASAEETIHVTLQYALLELAETLRENGMAVNAVPLIHEAGGIRSTFQDPSTFATAAKIRAEMGHTLYRLDPPKLEEAAAEYRKSLETLRGIRPTLALSAIFGGNDLFRLLISNAEVLEKLGRAPEGLDSLREAVAVARDEFERSPEPNALAAKVLSTCLQMLAVTAFKSGNFAEGLECATEALSMERGDAPSRQPEVRLKANASLGAGVIGDSGSSGRDFSDMDSGRERSAG